MKKIVFIVLALAMVVCVTAVFAQGGPPAGGNTGAPGGAPGGGNRGGNTRGGYGGGGMGMGMGVAGAVAPPMAGSIARWVTPLTLTQDQQDKLTPILTKSDTDLAAKRQKVTDANTALRNAILAPTFDATKVNGLLAAAQAAENDVIKTEMQTWADVRAQLTADQLAKLPAAMNARGTRGGGGRTRGNNPGGPPAGGPVPPPAPAPDAPPPAPAT